MRGEKERAEPIVLAILQPNVGLISKLNDAHDVVPYS